MAAKKKKMRSFEEGMQELDALVEKLSSSELPLQEAIALYEQGTALHAQLEALLAQQAGLHCVSIGPRILRCATAPVAAVCAIMYQTGNFDIGE